MIQELFNQLLFTLTNSYPYFLVMWLFSMWFIEVYQGSSDFKFVRRYLEKNMLMKVDEDLIGVDPDSKQTHWFVSELNGCEVCGTRYTFMFISILTFNIYFFIAATLISVPLGLINKYIFKTVGR